MNSAMHAFVRSSLLSAWLALFALSGCTVKLVADYDEHIDKGVTDLQKATEAFLLKLESNAGTPAAEYKNNKQFYDDAKVQISSLRLRADAVQRNSLTVRMLDHVQNNMDRLARDHAEGIGKDEIALYRGGFNSQFLAILTFELAKKRGQQPSESQAVAPATPNTAKGAAK